MRTAGYCLAITLSLVCSGCWPGGRKARVPVPVAALPVPVAPVVLPAAETPKPVPAPVAARPASPRVVRKPAATPPAIAPAPAPAPAPVFAPVPQLGEVLTPVRRRESEAELGASLQRARAALAQVAGRSITPAQHDTVERIRIFIQQSEAEKQKDISTAVQLARRADLLGQDLVKSLSQ